MELVPRKAFYEALGQLLKEERIRLGRSQSQVAFEIGVYASRLCVVESGIYPASAQLVWDIASSFCINPGNLLREAAAIAAKPAIP